MTILIATATNYPNRVIYGHFGRDLDQLKHAPAFDAFFEVACHGWIGTVNPFVNDQSMSEQHTAADLAAFISAQPQFYGQPIRLLICMAGAGPNSIAQQVALLLGTCVVAAAAEIYGETGATEDGSPYLFFTPPLLPRD